MSDRDLQADVGLSAQRPSVSKAAENAAPEPSQEHLKHGRDTAGRVDEALDGLLQRPQRDAESGKFVKGNVVGGKTLARSQHFWKSVEEAKRELVQRLEVDLGAADGAGPETLLGLIDAYAEARLFRHAMFRRLVELGGPITTKGTARVLYSSYLQALDRETRLALALGLERRPQPAPTLSELMEEE